MGPQKDQDEQVQPTREKEKQEVDWRKKKQKKERKQLLWIFSLQIKKKSNQSRLRRLIPGLLFWAGEEWNGTRLEYAKLCALSQELLGGETR